MKKSLLINPDHPCLPGHFPGQPIVPGVLLLDAVQAALEEELGVLSGLRLVQVKFLRPLLPAQAAELLLEAGSSAGRWRFRIQHQHELIASGEVVVS